MAWGSRCFADLNRENIRVLTMPSSIWASQATLPKSEHVKIQAATCLVRYRILVIIFAYPCNHSTYQRPRPYCPRFSNASITLCQQRSGLSLAPMISSQADLRQPFHNDVCDILAMYIQEQAVEGGESHLASCSQVYNEIASTRPDVIHTLAQPNWIFDKYGQLLVSHLLI